MPDPMNFSIVVTSSTDSSSITSTASLAKDGVELSNIAVAVTGMDSEAVEDCDEDFAKESPGVFSAMTAKDAKKAWSNIVKVFAKAVEGYDKKIFKD